MRGMWKPVLVTLVRKTPMVQRAKDHLPVYTLSFAYPQDYVEQNKTLDVRIDYGDVVKVSVPNYKPKSYSMSAERPGEFDITFKVYPNGRASGYLDRLQIGEQISVFRHPACNKQRNPGDNIGIIAYGVGITEALPVAAAELAKPEARSVVLLWASRTMGDTFWHNQVVDLQEKYEGRFEIVYILSREETDTALQGRINPQVLEDVFDRKWYRQRDSEKVRFLCVGTKEMMKETNKMLGTIGYPMPKHALLQ